MADIKVRLGSENAVKVLSTVPGAGTNTLSGLNDIDFTGGLLNGMLLQYDSAALRWKGSLDIIPKTININQGTITSNNPFFSASVNWNNSAVSFTGLKVNVTNISSLYSSKIVDYQIAGVSKFSISASGISTFTDQVYFGNSLFLSLTNSGISTRGVPYFSSIGQLLSTNSPEVGYASTSNYVLTTDASNVPVWSSVIDGGQY